MRTTARSTVSALVLIAAVALAVAERKPPSASKAPDTEAQPPKQLERANRNLTRNPVIVAAAQVKPVAPEMLARKVPEKLGRFTRGKVATFVHQFGPAMYSEIRGPLTTADNRTAALSLLDCAGLPPATIGRPALPKPGETIEGRTGLDLGGYRAATEKTPTGARVDVEVSPRLRLRIEGEKFKVDELLAAARALDLAGIAALAP